MSDVYGLDDAAGRWRSAAITLAAEVLSPHAAEVDAQAQFPAEGMAGLARGGFYGLCLDT
jgi:Acyl-CoA dehydrogenase, N-terminal domain